jgi:hypothetical protein
MINQTLDSEPEAGIRPLVARRPCRALGSKLSRVLFWGLPLVLLLAAGCASRTFFQSNFDQTAIDQPPAHAQAVGTATIEGGVLVVAVPDASVKGVRFSRISSSNSAVLHCDLSQPPGDGTYVFSTVLYLPSKSGGKVTIQFEQSGGGQHFMHLDFLGNSVTIDDDPSTTFGNFPRDQVFIVQVTLYINASPSAHIVLSGAGASGEANRNVSPNLLPIVRQFGAVRISTDLAADESSFYAANIVVMQPQ